MPNNGIQYRIEVDSAVLNLRRVRVNPTVALAHEQGLSQRNALYHFDRRELQTFTFAAGTRNKSLDSITHGQLPKFLLLGMVTQTAFNGSAHNNPFWFQAFSLASLNLFVNGAPNVWSASRDTGKPTLARVCAVCAQLLWKGVYDQRPVCTKQLLHST